MDRNDNAPDEEEVEEKTQQEKDEESARYTEERQRRVKDSMALFAHLSKKLRVRRHTGGTASSRNSERWDVILRTKDIHLTFFSMAGVAISIIMSYLKWYWRCRQDSNGDCHVTDSGIAADTPYSAATVWNSSKYLASTWTSIMGLQIALTASTCICLVLIVQYFKLVLRDRRREWSGLEELDLIEAHGDEASRQKQFFDYSYKFWDSGLRWQVFLELLLHAIHPMVFLEGQLGGTGSTIYELSECFMFLRLYLVLRVIFENSDIYIFRADIVGSNKELQERNYQVSATAAYKILFYTHPGKLIVIVALTMILVFGFWIFVVERNNTPLLQDLPNCYWLVWATISSVGYGDVVVTSKTGKIIIIIVSVVSMLVLILFSGIVTNLLSPTREQRYIQSFLEQRDAEEEHRNAAVAMIETAFLERRERRRLAAMRGGSMFLGEKRSPQMYAAIKRVRRARLSMRQSFGAAVDPVVDTKLQEAIILGHRLNKHLHEQGQAILFLQQRLLTSMSLVKKQLSAQPGVEIKQDEVGKDPITKKYAYSKYISTI